MKNAKKYSIIALILSIVLLSACSAEASSDVVVSLTLNNTKMQVNGVETSIDEGRDTAPVIVNDRILVPIRAIIEIFGGNVVWDGITKTIDLSIDNQNIVLRIGNNVAFVNGRSETLDVPPEVINERVMLPIRFVAEGFNFGVAWDSETKTVSIISNTFDDAEYASLMKILPDYSGTPYTVINDNKPFFKGYEIIGGSFEYYSFLDEIGRCDVCMASVGTDLMPTEERESISSVKPTGWENEKYSHVDGGYLYNRCHLIGFQLTGENANERNLITGTRYLNVDGMLPFENMVDDYVERTGNNVMYRVTPVFSNNNLVADGVLLEAYSVEDDGRGLSFCVYCYNVQPGVEIDYATGKNTLSNNDFLSDSGVNVYRTYTGKRYHINEECGGKNSYSVTLEDAVGAGLTPCERCTN